MNEETIQGELDKVRDYIIEHGWIQGTESNDRGAVCLMGGFGRTYGYVYNPKNYLDDCQEAIRELRDRICVVNNGTYRSITLWNDHPKRTLDEVLTILSDKWETLIPER